MPDQQLVAKDGGELFPAPEDSGLPLVAGMTGLRRCAAFFPAVILASGARPGPRMMTLHGPVTKGQSPKGCEKIAYGHSGLFENAS